MEFARAMACLGKLNSPEMRRARSAELAEMATIKGKTISELEREIAETQEELTKSKADRRRVQQELRQVASNAMEGTASQADLLFLKHDVQLADEKITIFLDKLQRLDVQLARLRSQEEKEESGTNRELQEEEMINEEERETRAKKSSTRGRPKPQKSRATPSKARKPKSRQTPTPKKRASTADKRNKNKPRFTETEIAEGQQQASTPEQLKQQMEFQYHLQQMHLEMQRLQQLERDEKIKEIPPQRQGSWRTRHRRGAETTV
ncbi:tropomyosin 1 alpha chain, putative [Eimeria acervulina]|uniref:Tropomyosin 1 alpha chain, putative n=1 Tax=Eimeria acervulina TaxID=5801 RepID=U6GAL2_EIMAC|nr:tropomyosin 1 alpha chain, putative [Eimeria acervulina]CDI76537.1 tropomyosin 1 alpha chain, putative [Eimeria acervulina]